MKLVRQITACALVLVANSLQAQQLQVTGTPGSPGDDTD